MSETTPESSPGDNIADQLNAQAEAENPAGDSPPDTTETEAAEVTAEVGAPTPAAGDGPHQSPVPAEPSDFVMAWMESCDQWIHGHLRNSPLAQATEAWNHVMAKLPLLGAMVEAKLSSKKE